MWKKINKLKDYQVLIILSLAGLLAYGDGLFNAFTPADKTNIVNNPVLHSLSHFFLFFQGGTTYTGQGVSALHGTTYSPISLSVYSMVYSIVGAHTFAYHLLQLIIGVATSFVLFLFFKHSFKLGLSLLLALIFLLHPLNSQVMFSISALPDSLAVFFGVTSLYVLSRSRSFRAEVVAGILLLLALLTKDVAWVFIPLSLVYLYWEDEEEFISYSRIAGLVFVIWFVLDITAVGLLHNPHLSPVDNLSLVHRLVATPSLLMFYLAKLVMPIKLTSGYNVVHSSITTTYFWLPALAELALLALVVYLAFYLAKKGSKSAYYTYLFFLLWTVLSLLTLTQILPQSFSASESWFYLVMIGLLGLIGVLLSHFKLKINAGAVMAICLVLLVVLGARTAVRGRDWNNPVTLVKQSAAASGTSSSPSSKTALAEAYNQSGSYRQAGYVALDSVKQDPTAVGYYQLGVALEGAGNIPEALTAYNDGLKYSDYYLIYERQAEIVIANGSANNLPEQYVEYALKKVPNDGALWQDLAVAHELNNNHAAAVSAIKTANSDGGATDYIYKVILANQPFSVNYPVLNKTINVP